MVTLKPCRDLVAVLALAFLLAAPADARSIQVLVRAHTSASPASVKLSAVSADRGVRHEATVTLETGRGEASLDLSAEQPWRLTGVAPGLWSAPAVVGPSTTGPVAVDLWPASELAAALGPPELARDLRALEVSMHVPPGVEAADQPVAADTTCAVAKSKLQSCVLPAGRWNIRITPSGFIPRYAWNHRLEPGKPADIGTLTLKRGASLFGRVRLADGTPSVAAVELRPSTAGFNPVSEAEAGRLRELRLRVRANEWGYFHFDAVPAGTYDVVATREGFAPAVLESFAIRPEEAARLRDPLVLERPLPLAVSVDPESDVWGKAWRVRMQRKGRSGDLSQVADGSTVAGRWRSPALPPGEYVVQVLDSREESQDWETFTLSADDDHLDVSLDLISVVGQVRLGDDPLPAKLWFGGRAGTVRIATEGDEDGKFATVLPHGGEWSVDLESSDPVVEAKGLSVDVQPSGSSHRASVRIRLPDTTVEGEVVDTAGRSVPGAAVQLVGFGKTTRHAQTLTDEDGQFELHGQTPGTYTLEAVLGNRKSSVQILSLAEKIKVGPFRLVVEEGSKLQGTLRGPDGPVAQAIVMGFPISSSGTMAAMALPTASSDVQGRFELDLPPATAFVRLLVLAPGRVLHLQRVDLGAALPVEISLGEEDGGTLTLPPLERSRAGARLLLIDGEPLDIPLLSRWAQLSGAPGGGKDGLVVPEMPAGRYAYCQLSGEEAMMVMGGAAAPKRSACSEGFLPEGGELTLAQPGGG